MSPAKFKAVFGGWRSGKSTVGALELLFNIPRLPSPFWIVAPTYEVPKRAEVEYLIRWLKQLHLLEDASIPVHGPCKLVACGGKEIVVKSATDPEKLASEAPSFLLVCEAGQLSEDVMPRVLGRAIERNSTIMLTGTLEQGCQWYRELYYRWQGDNVLNARSFSLPTWSNTAKFKPGRHVIVLEDGTRVEGVNRTIYQVWLETPSDMFQEYYAGIPCKPSTLVIREFNPAVHVKDIQFDPNLPVELAIDPGYAGANVVEAVQLVGDTVHVIDEIYEQNILTDDVIAICQARPWWGNVTGGVIDIAGTQHHGVVAPAEVWEKKAGKKLRCGRVLEEAGIEVLRSFLRINPETGRTKMYVSPKCRGFISECGAGRSPVLGGGPWERDKATGKPLHKNDHACKALIYYLVDKFGYAMTLRSRTRAMVRSYYEVR